MKLVLSVLMLLVSIQCSGSTFDADTIDTWKVYNGEKLLLSGNVNQQNLKTVVRKAELKEIKVLFNHCVKPTEDFSVMIELFDDRGKRIHVKNFKSYDAEGMTIYKSEIENLSMKYFKIRYKENRANGTDLMLGLIQIEK